MTSSASAQRPASAITNPHGAVENDAINTVRVVAALLVVLSHVRELLLVDFDYVPHTLLERGLYGVSALGKQAVVVFFVLSGFWVGGAIVRRYRQGRFRWPDYAIDRIVRLWLVFIPALLLTAALDGIGRAIFPASTVYVGSSLYAGVVGPSPSFDDPINGVLNALFLVGVAVPSFGSNSALWSIGYEFWMYAVGALAIYAVLRRRPMIAALSAAVLLGSLLVNSDLLIYVSIWGLGALIAATASTWRRLYIAHPRAGVTIRVVAAIATLGAAVVVRGLSTLPLLPATWIVAIPAAILLASLVSYPPRSIRRGLLGFASYLAASSYSLYAIHTPIAILLTAAMGLQVTNRWPADPLHWLIVLAVVGFLAVLGWAFAQGTERHTGRIRALFRRVFKVT